jgi:hypothetical protein
MGYSGVRGKLIYEKNLKLKISCQTPFKHSSIKDLRTLGKWTLLSATEIYDMTAVATCLIQK